MRIGEVAGRSGVPEKTLRYYEDVGLVDHPLRMANGYRDYPDEVIDRLRFVRSAQAVGLSLAEIREVVALRDRGDTPCKHVLELIDRHATEIDARIVEWQTLRRELHELAVRGRELDPRDCSPQEICHVIPPRSVKTAALRPRRRKTQTFERRSSRSG